MKRAAFIADTCVLAAALTCSMVLMPMAPVLALGLAWWLHRRLFDRAALLGGLTGLVAGAAGVSAVFFAVVMLNMAIGSIGGRDYLFAVLSAGVFAVAFVCLVIAVAAGAIRDLAPARRENVRLDVVRLVSAGVIAVAMIVVLALQLTHPGTEYSELAIFALLAGAISAWVADAVWLRIGGGSPASADAQPNSAP